MPESTHVHPAPERTDIRLRAIAVVGFFLAIGIGAVALVADFVVRLTGIPAESFTIPKDRSLFVSGNPTRERIDLERDAERRLHEYRLVDGDPQYARIPIDRAMDLMLKRGDDKSQ